MIYILNVKKLTKKVSMPMFGIMVHRPESWGPRLPACRSIITLFHAVIDLSYSFEIRQFRLLT
jgi:hypothetical protein